MNDDGFTFLQFCQVGNIFFHQVQGTFCIPYQFEIVFMNAAKHSAHHYFHGLIIFREQGNIFYRNGAKPYGAGPFYDRLE